MSRPFAVEFRRLLLTLVASMVSGALAGASAGWTVAASDVGTGAAAGTQTTAQQTATTTGSEITIIPVDRTPQPTLVPAPFVGRASSVAALYRRVKAMDDGLLTEDRLIAQVVAVTSDGWFVTPATVLQGIRPADVVLWHEGVSASTTRIVVDRLSGIAFLKTSLTGLNAPAFARANDVTAGLSAWLERRANRFEPRGILALSDPLQSLDGQSSEVVGRRGIAAGTASAGDIGAPLWSGNGALLGLTASAPGTSVSYIPASAWASSLTSLLTNGEIRHALLGVRSANLAWAQLDAARSGLPNEGALLHDDKVTRKPAVTPASPAAVAGLRAGDVILRVDRDILDASQDLGELLAAYRPGSKVTLMVLRAGQTQDIPVALGSVVTGEELR